MECENCAFWFVDIDAEPGERPYCHYSGDNQYAPCEEEFDEIHIPHDECD